MLGAATLTVYPNPSQGTAQVRVTWPQAERGVLRVLDALGREITVQTTVLAADEQTLTLRERLQPGFYVVELIAPSRRLSQRLVVQ